MAIYVYGGVRHEARVWELSMNLFSATGEFVLEATINLLLRLSVQKGVWNSMDSMVCTDTLMTLVILFSWFLAWWYLRMTLLWCILISSWWQSYCFAVFWSGNIYNRTDFWPQRCFVRRLCFDNLYFNFEDFMMFSLLDCGWVGEFIAWMHVSLLKKPAVVQSFLRNNKLHNIRTFLVGCEKSRFHVCRGFRVFGILCLLADANTADRTLCKYL